MNLLCIKIYVEFIDIFSPRLYLTLNVIKQNSFIQLTYISYSN